MADKILTCECGFSVQGSDDEIVAKATEHGVEIHQMDLTRDQILAMAKPTG